MVSRKKSSYYHLLALLEKTKSVMIRKIKYKNTKSIKINLDYYIKQILPIKIITIDNQLIFLKNMNNIK